MVHFQDFLDILTASHALTNFHSKWYQWITYWELNAVLRFYCTMMLVESEFLVSTHAYVLIDLHSGGWFNSWTDEENERFQHFQPLSKPLQSQHVECWTSTHCEGDKLWQICSFFCSLLPSCTYCGFLCNKFLIAFLLSFFVVVTFSLILVIMFLGKIYIM